MIVGESGTAVVAHRIRCGHHAASSSIASSAGVYGCSRLARRAGSGRSELSAVTDQRASSRASAAFSRANAAFYDEAVLTITSQQQTAEALLQTTRAVAANTPIQLDAAQQSEMQARARYDAGLATILEVDDTGELQGS